MTVLEPQYTTAEAAALVRRHVVTIRIALEGGELHGSQTRKGGRWLIAEACLSAYARGEQCEHQAAAKRASVRPLRRGRAA